MKRWARAVALAALAGAAMLGAPSVARAQSAKASAEVLFAEGRRLVSEGKLEEACPKFVDSQKLDPSSGTLINLANCYEKLGKNASAWAVYQEAASLAQSSARPDHLAVAQKRAAAMFTTLAKVTVLVPHPVDGLEIKRDGVPVAKGEWGLGVPVDPGTHAYVAVAPGYKPGTVQITVPPTPEGGTPPSLQVTIPDLEKLPPTKAPPVVAPPVVVAPVAPVAPVGPPPNAWRPQRTGALVMGGLALVGAGVGVGFAVSAKSTYNTSLASCRPSDPSDCNATGANQRNDAKRQGDIATVGAVGGGVAAAIGIVLWFTAPPASAPARPAVGLSFVPGGGMVKGRW